MEYKIAIDADSIVYKSCSRHNSSDGTECDLEKAYFEFCGEIAKICSDVFTRGIDGNIGIVKYEKGDSVVPLIVLSPKKSFRNQISPSGVKFRINKLGNKVDMGYKANRKPSKITGINELKIMIYKRLGNMVALYKQAGAEADDVVNWLAREHGYLVAAIDKDVINANPTYCYNYNDREWNSPRTQEQIEQWYLVQTLMGDTTDNVEGAPGIGEKGARDIIYGKLGGKATFNDILPYFNSRFDAALNHMLVRMDRFDGTKINPIEQLKELDDGKDNN